MGCMLDKKQTKKIVDDLFNPPDSRSTADGTVVKKKAKKQSAKALQAAVLKNMGIEPAIDNLVDKAKLSMKKDMSDSPPVGGQSIDELVDEFFGDDVPEPEEEILDVLDAIDENQEILDQIDANAEILMNAETTGSTTILSGIASNKPINHVGPVITSGSSSSVSRIADEDIERIATRVVELLKENWDLSDEYVSENPNTSLSVEDN